MIRYKQSTINQTMNNKKNKIKSLLNNPEPTQDHHSVYPRWGTTRLRLLFLVPLAIAIAIIILVLGMMLHQQADQDLREGVIRIRASAQEFYTESIRYDASALRAIMHTLIRNEKLSSALANRDKEQLLRYGEPLFNKIRQDFNITHLYFHGTDRVNLLRVHAPYRNGDLIKRITMLQAESSGSISYGVELGPLGTFTLRLVSPCYDQQTGTLIGYIELGMEIDEVIKKLQDFFGVRVFILIKKEFLERNTWEEGMRTLGRTPHWDRFPEEVVSESSDDQFSTLLNEYFVQGSSVSNTIITDLKNRDLSLRVSVLPLADAANREVARMILLTDVSEEENIAQKTVFAGTLTALAIGFVLFVFFYWLVGRIGHHIERNERELHRLATHDGLTGLYNHRVFYAMLEEEISRSKRFHRTVSLLILDIDHFKRINDTYGHRAGDCILRDLSQRLKSRVRSIDRVCRYGGEEITVILSETDSLMANKLAEDLRELVKQETFDADQQQMISISVSIGVATYPEHATDVSQLVSHADKALYQAKESGRDRVCIYQSND